ncbi:MAG: energy coupling factor transporter S component ThiW [Synergistaceae bacterium]|nr:energy coupling factor transporter S component ThiW [Synergistaceae bacterium]
MFAAIAVLLSGFSFPIGPSRCFPFQHAVNVIAGVLLGPWWALGGAFISSMARNMLGTGTILAFPGSMCGALAVGFAANTLSANHRAFAAAAEPLATGLLGAWIASLIATNSGSGPMFTLLSIAFLASSVPGALIGYLALYSLKTLYRRVGEKAGNC